MISFSAPRWWITQPSVPGREFSDTVVTFARHGRALAATGRGFPRRGGPRPPPWPGAGRHRADRAHGAATGRDGAGHAGGGHGEESPAAGGWVHRRHFYTHLRTYSPVVNDRPRLA